ncbi:MAG: alpha/beta hydrolase [Bacilli bacterium]
MRLFTTAVLIIHGFSGSVSDSEYLINELEMDPSIDMFFVTLTGHDRPILYCGDCNQWIEDAEKVYKKIRKSYKNVIVIGHSMGGIIATHIATKYNPKKLILISPAFEYFNSSQIKKDITNFTKLKELIADYENPNAYQMFGAKLITTTRKARIEFKKLVKMHKEDIKYVKCPTLLIHGTIDEVVPISSSIYAYENLNIDKKYFCTMENIRHIPQKSEKKDIAIDLVHRFIKGGSQWKEKNKFTK